MVFEDVPVKSVQKALVLLDHLALHDVGRRRVSLAALAEVGGLPLNTARNLLKTLISCGYVAQRGHGVYLAGAKCAQMGRVARATDAAVRPRMLARLQRFTETTGEGCVCSILADGHRVVVAAVDSTQAIRVSQATVEDTPFFAKPTGRLLAALADEEELQAILARHGLPGAHWDEITDEDTLRHALADLRRQPVCEVEQLSEGLISIVCTIPDAEGRCWGVVGTYAPAYRCPPARRQHLADSLRHLSLELARLVYDDATQP